MNCIILLEARALSNGKIHIFFSQHLLNTFYVLSEVNRKIKILGRKEGLVKTEVTEAE